MHRKHNIVLFCLSTGSSETAICLRNEPEIAWRQSVGYQRKPIILNHAFHVNLFIVL